jgi:glycosyltransferase involved in cell wall biosynthesis
VAVGIPVRDGGAVLEHALRSIVDQTHENLEIVISDNASTDNTAEICKRFAREDRRVRYVRQPVPITVNANFRFVFEQCESDWFMWAAHDDVRDKNYIEVLLAGFAAHPRAALTFAKLNLFSDREHAGAATAPGRQLEVAPLEGVPFPERHRVLVANGPLSQFYGVFRAEVLRTYRWPEVRYGHDWLILHWAITFGDSVYVPGSTFHYFVPRKARPPRQYNEYQALRSTWLDGIRSRPDVSWAWHASRELAFARNALGFPTRRRDLFTMLCFIHQGGRRTWAKRIVYWNAPAGVRRVWDRVASATRTRFRADREGNGERGS